MSHTWEVWDIYELLATIRATVGYTCRVHDKNSLSQKSVIAIAMTTTVVSEICRTPLLAYALKKPYNCYSRCFLPIFDNKSNSYNLGALKKLTIIGGGSWATALTKIFSESGVDVCWYLRSRANVDELKKTGRNPSYLSYLPLPMEHLYPTSDINEAVRFSDTLLFAIPSAYLVAGVSGIDPEIMSGKRFLTSIKGVVGDKNQLPTDYLGHWFNINVEQQAVIGGPCHAEEVAMERKTYVTIASKNKEFATDIASAIQSHYIKTIQNPDPIGVEYAAILKNVIGIACGIAKGLNYGDNFQAVIVSNAMNEIQQFLKAVDHVNRQLFHSAYFGDLLVTTYSEFSRNRTFGQMIGRGYTVQLAQLQMSMVAEGYYAVEGIYALARKLPVEMPIVSAVYRILYNHISPYVEFKLLEDKLI